MSDYQEGEVLVNPSTGEQVQLVKGEWKPLSTTKTDSAEIAATKKPDDNSSSGFLRGMQVGVKDLMSGAMGVPSLVADVATLPFAAAYNAGKAGYNKLTGNEGGYAPLIGRTQGQFDQTLTAAGFPESENPMISAITRGVAGAGTGMGAGTALSQSAAPLAKRLASVLTSAPKTQLAVSVASPVAGEAVKESGGGPLAQTAAELGAGLAVGGLGSLSRSGSAARSVEELRNASSNAYKAAENAGAIFTPSSYDRFFSGLAADVHKSGFDPGLHPKISAVLSRLDSEQGNPQTLQNMEILRRVTKSAAASTEPDERRIAGVIQDHLDDFVENAGPSDILAGDAPAAISSLKDARKLWSQASKGGVVENLVDRAKLSAPNFSASGMENALRTEFRALAKNERKMRMFSADEREAIRKVAVGGPVGNTLRALGRFGSPSSVGIATSGITGAMLGGPAGAVALPLVGRAAREGAAAMTKRNVDLASALMRGGKIPSSTGIDKEKLAAALAAMSASNAGQQ